MRLAPLLALLLAGCSGYSAECDPAGDCLQTWRDGGMLSGVTASRLVGPDGRPLPGATLAIQGGAASYVSPFASGSSEAVSAASDARALAR